MENILEVKNLSVSFHSYIGEISAVRDVSFSLKPGETLAIVGESGCGKTVTVKALMRLFGNSAAVIKESSQILFKGRDIARIPKRELYGVRGSGISMIFQDPMTSLNPTMNVGDQITEGMFIHNPGISRGKARARAVELLEMVGIPSPGERLGSYPHELSGGMRQRIMIAIAIACEPDIIIADEPTTALDVTIQAQVLELLTELKNKTNTAFILVTHNLGIVFDFSDRINVMYAGSIVERGTKHEIYKNPQHPYTWALLNSIPRRGLQGKDELYSIKGKPPDLMLRMEYCPFAPRCEYAMPICRQRIPQAIDLSKTHGVACWLQHSMAPKVERPGAIGGTGNE